MRDLGVKSNFVNSVMSWATATGLSARPTLPNGVRVVVYGATSAQAQSVAAGTALTWIINGDKVEVTA